MNRSRPIHWTAVRQNSMRFCNKLARRKEPSYDDDSETGLSMFTRFTHWLNTADLTCLGTNIACGFYIVIGLLVREIAGPASMLSIIIAAIASLFSGGCYAEFAVRLPDSTASTYKYAYAKAGELMAYNIGWIAIFESIIGTCACARAISACVDMLVSGAINAYVKEKIGTFNGEPPDIMAFSLCLVMNFALVFGIKRSIGMTLVTNTINLLVWIFLMGASVFYWNTDNWSDKGFLPYGWSGVLKGASVCFYGFGGFDVIATMGQEARNPLRSIPKAISTSLIIVLVVYSTSSMTLTLTEPYDKVDINLAFMGMFSSVNAYVCKYIMMVGALVGLTASMYGAMCPLPGIVFAMASDGLIFKQLAILSERFRTPALATICTGFITAILALMIQLPTLVEMMSIGSLLSYMLISTSVFVLRYQPITTTDVLSDESDDDHQDTTNSAGSHVESNEGDNMFRRVSLSFESESPSDEEFDEEDESYMINPDPGNEFYARPAGFARRSTWCTRFFNYVHRRVCAIIYMFPEYFQWIEMGPATQTSGLYVVKAIGVFYVLTLIFAVLAVNVTPSAYFTIVFMMLVLLAIVLDLLAISRKPQTRDNLLYPVPLMPFVPAIAIMANMYLIVNLSGSTQLKMAIWLITGLVIYFKYGINNSTLATHEPMPETPTLPPPNASRQADDVDEECENISNEFNNIVLNWHEPNIEPVSPPPRFRNQFMEITTRFDERTNTTSNHTIMHARHSARNSCTAQMYDHAPTPGSKRVRFEDCD